MYNIYYATRGEDSSISHTKSHYLARWLEGDKVHTLTPTTSADGYEFAAFSGSHRYDCGLGAFMFDIPCCRVKGALCFEISIDPDSPLPSDNKLRGRRWGCKVCWTNNTYFTHFCHNANPSHHCSLPLSLYYRHFFCMPSRIVWWWYCRNLRMNVHGASKESAFPIQKKLQQNMMKIGLELSPV